MASYKWQLQTPISAVIFDCDGTLSAIEGIDELARKKGVYQEVASLTEHAMGRLGINPEIYQQRLQWVKPHLHDVLTLGHQYFHHRVTDASAVVQLLQRLKKSVYIVSSGLYPAVMYFGAKLQIPKENIFAVHIDFDAHGYFLDFDKHSPLIQRDGKRVIATQLLQSHSSVLHIGDGLNDYVTHDVVTRFIGYGGIFYRENLAARCDYYIRTPSLAPLLPLIFTPEELTQLLPEERSLYQKGLRAILTGEVDVRN
jgi:phosphoserine phosphatase